MDEGTILTGDYDRKAEKKEWGGAEQYWGVILALASWGTSEEDVGLRGRGGSTGVIWGVAVSSSSRSRPSCGRVLLLHKDPMPQA